MGVEPGTFGTETDNTWCTEWTDHAEVKNAAGDVTKPAWRTCNTWPKQ